MQTAAWALAAQNQRGELFFDMKFFNTAAPDPVLRSDLVKLKLFAAVTPEHRFRHLAGECVSAGGDACACRGGAGGVFGRDWRRV